MTDKKNIWEKLEKKFNKYPQDFTGPSSIEEIKKNEQSLAVQFSPSYKKFLLLYSSMGLEGHCIYGTKPHRFMGITLNNVVSKTEFYRGQQYPGTENWYIISDDGSGNPFGVDPEGKVWLSDHDSYEIVPVAEDFEEFLYKLYTDTLWPEE